MTAPISASNADTSAPAGTGPGQSIVPIAGLSRAGSAGTLPVHVDAEFEVSATITSGSAALTYGSAELVGGGAGGFVASIALPSDYASGLARLKLRSARLTSNGTGVPFGGEFRAYLLSAAPTLAASPTDGMTTVDALVGASDALLCLSMADVSFEANNLFKSGMVGFGGPASPFMEQSFPAPASLDVVMATMSAGYAKIANEAFTWTLKFQVIFAA